MLIQTYNAQQAFDKGKTTVSSPGKITVVQRVFFPYFIFLENTKAITVLHFNTKGKLW